MSFGAWRFKRNEEKRKEGKVVQIAVPVTVVATGAKSNVKPVTTTPNAKPGSATKTTSTQAQPYAPPPPPDPNLLKCYFEERMPGKWWYGVEDKFGDKEHPYDHYGTFPTFADAYEHMHTFFWEKKPGVTDFNIFPNQESNDDSWMPYEDKKKGFVK